ncbi:MAG: aminoglycoside phosphotransferase, partial [Paraburkholderia hospita]
MTLPLVSSLTSASSTADARLELLGAWLQTHAGRYSLDLATLKPASADASFRRYFRLAGSGAELVAGGATVIAV